METDVKSVPNGESIVLLTKGGAKRVNCEWTNTKEEYSPLTNASILRQTERHESAECFYKFALGLVHCQRSKLAQNHGNSAAVAVGG